MNNPPTRTNGRQYSAENPIIKIENRNSEISPGPRASKIHKEILNYYPVFSSPQQPLLLLRQIALSGKDSAPNPVLCTVQGIYSSRRQHNYWPSLRENVLSYYLKILQHPLRQKCRSLTIFSRTGKQPHAQSYSGIAGINNLKTLEGKTLNPKQQPQDAPQHHCFERNAQV